MLPVSDERGASTRYRVLAHLEALEDAGLRCQVRTPLDSGRTGVERLVRRAADLVTDLYSPVSEDLLFIHRKTYLPPLASRLRRERRPVVFDMDDAIDLPPPGKEPGRLARERYRRNFEATVSAADLVICGNDYLASRLPHQRFEVLPTPIDTRRFSPGRLPVPGEPAVGWVGYSDNLPYLQSLDDVFRELARRHPGFRLIVVADRPMTIDGVKIEFRRWSLEEEVACFGGIRVGLMPMTDSPWARGKCAFKALQYMALGIPTVASPVGMNRQLIHHGENGFLPRDSEGWIEALDALLSDPERARTIGWEGRRSVVAGYSLDVVSARLVELLAFLIHEGCGAYSSSSNRA
jgi:glycosyltransferase involved in cell wall biosynthesis